MMLYDGLIISATNYTNYHEFFKIKKGIRNFFITMEFMKIRGKILVRNGVIKNLDAKWTVFNYKQ